MSARLEVNDGLGQRIVPISKDLLQIGRRTESDLRLVGSDVSREHAEIVKQNGDWILRDKGSRYGTYVNGEAVTEHKLTHGDKVQFGRASGADVTFLTGDGPAHTDRSHASAVNDLRQLASLLEGLRALGSGRVLDEVLSMVLDTAIDVAGAERGFIMLAQDGKALDMDMKMARAKGRVTLPGTGFKTSRKIPEEVYATGELKIVADLLDGDLANVHLGTVQLGIRHVACIPLRMVRYLDRADMKSETRNIGVLYLDSREKGSLLAPHTRTALDTLATEAGVAIENARLYRETLEKARIEHELKVAAEIQKALLPEGKHTGPFFESAGTSVQARAIGGDFFDMQDMPDGQFGFLCGDVAGKGPAAALLTSKILGIFSAFVSVGDSPEQTVDHINKVLTRRAIDARYATLLYGQLSSDGKLIFCNAGHNPPLIYGADGLRRIESGGMPVGLFEMAPYSADTIQLKPGDTMVCYSDGVTEAHNVEGGEFGEARLVEVLEKYHRGSADVVLEQIINAVTEFAHGAEQYDDVTALVVKYTGPAGSQ
ncbi:MAG TPA: SpoIIE family protein phosphatase [Vicinamibacterales bacterium]|nr:SpoIIE family protein phosphatase [Vicinamibacterales bacterium]